ncbi:MAG TPA: hypothetical protein VH186_18090, partial [Chloroflexia bacterium]|nr:hypothetical protein [Chloroflexia bacterium]
MDAPMNPNDRKVYRKREETVYDQAAPVQPVRPVQPVTPPPATNAQYSYTQSGDLQTENVQQGYYDAAGNLVQKEEHVVDDTYT